MKHYTGTKSTPTDDLPDLLLQCRADRHLSQAAVAKSVGVTRQNISMIEKRKSSPYATTRIRLVEFLKRHGYFVRTREVA